MGRLNESMIREHPALAAFRQYIQENSGETPAAEAMLLANRQAGDGRLELSYLGPRGDIFVAQLDAGRTLEALQLRHGRLQANGRTEWIEADAANRNVADACRTVHTLGGEAEASFQCPVVDPSAPPSSTFGSQRDWLGQFVIANWSGIEAVNFLRRWRGATAWHAQSPAMTALRNGRGWMTPVGSNELGLTQRIAGYGTVGGAGVLAMLGSQQVSDMAGLHPDFHANERFAIGSFSSYGTMAGMTHLLNRSRPAGTRLSGPSLGAGLISSALVDATLGQMWTEGSGERQALRMGSFFLPQLYSMAFGSRSLALAETRTMGALGRWGNRAFIATAIADGAFMGYNSLSHGNRETARSNLIYRRANQLQDAELHPLVWALDGAAEMLAPSLSERLFTSGSYVRQAEAELDTQSSDAARRLRHYLGQALLMGPDGPATDARFYTELNWGWLRGASTMDGFRRANGRLLPVAMVADQLSDPEIHRRIVENGSPEEQIAYIQRQFRGHDLSRTEVEEIFARIALHQARQEIQNLYYAAGSDVAGLSNCFDEQGELIAGREGELLAQVFPGHELGAEQVLALRRVALSRRILELQQSDPAGQLAALNRVAREIGLIDESGQLLDGEESRLARASLESHPLAPPPATAAPRARPSDLDIIRAIANHGARG